MPFEKGNKYGRGRKKGQPNKTTAVMKSILNNALFGDEKSIAKDLEELSAKDRLLIKVKFAQFILPTQKSVETMDLTEDTTSLAARLENFTDEEIEKANNLYIHEQLQKKEKPGSIE